MHQIRSKTRSKSEEFYFSDESVESIVPEKDPKAQTRADFLLMINEDPDGESPNESSTKQQNSQQRKQSIQDDYPFKVEIKSEYSSSSIYSSLMDLEDIFSYVENDQESGYEDESQWLDRYLNKNKEKKRANDKINCKDTDGSIVKIQENPSCKQHKLSGYKGNRKIRTTISEEKIKIMEHLFPYVANSTPYKGTVLTLKDVAKIVDLGYSTILHKYKDFRQKGEVQKGLLLRCKDFKRKYNKSLIIENHIKKALKEGEFKTAKELANFISEKYKINANRSIISRHLNEMQRQKCKMEEKKVQVPGKRNSCSVYDETIQKLKEFCLVFLALQNQKVNFSYFTILRLYLVEGRLSYCLKSQVQSFKVINLSITATQTSLKEYYPHFVNEADVILARNLRSLDSSAYKILYSQLQNHVEDNELDIETSNDDERAYVIFPYKNIIKESEYRHKKLEDLMSKKISILTIPPDFKIKNLNFIKNWFIEQVMLELEEIQFLSVVHCKESILAVMNNNQSSLTTYSNKMINSFKNF